jgi:iron complex outermembrane receptor protein
MSGATTFAQDGDVIEEVIVTATRRAEIVRNVPLAITAYDANFIKATGLDNVKDLIKFTPGFAGDSKDSFIDFVNVRGISTNDFGIGGEPSIGFFKDGLYQGRQGTAVSSLYDLERAEVLRGPQGFLFGRNAISGAISFYTKKPDFDDSSGYFSTGVGERGVFQAEGAVNIPLSDSFAVRIAGYKSQEDGWVTNTAMPGSEKMAGHDNVSGRITLGMRGEKFDGTISAEVEDRETSGTLYRAVLSDPALQPWMDTFGADIAPRADRRTVHNDQQLGNFDTGKILSFSADLNFDLGWASVKSLTGYKDHKYDYAEDYDGTSIGLNDYLQDQEGSYFEQELRLVSQSEGPLSWYAGVSYYKEKIDAKFGARADENAMCGVYYYYYDNCADLYDYWGYPGFMTTPEGLREDNHSKGTYSGWGAYVEGTFEVSDQLDFSVGMRYTKDTKEFGFSVLPVTSELGPWYYYGYTTNGFVTSKQSWSDMTPRFIARYRPNDDMMVYASVTKGYKTGGYNSFGLALGPDGVVDGVVQPGAEADSFDAETVWSYELGLKGSAADSRLRYDFSAYRYTYKDLQLNYWDAGTIVDNIGSAKAYGFEGSVQALLSDSFDLVFSGSYNSNKISGAEFIEPGSTGNRLSGTPKVKVSGLFNYHIPVAGEGELTASAEFVRQSSVYIGISNAKHSQQDGWADVSFRLRYDSNEAWAITAYVENAFDEIYFDAGYDGGDLAPAVIFGVSRPRTFGINFSMRFGE